MARDLTISSISRGHLTDPFWWNADIENNVCTEKHSDLSEFSCWWPFKRARERQQRGVLFLISLLTTNTSCLGHRKHWRCVNVCEERIHVCVTWTAPPPSTPLFFKWTCGRLTRLVDTNHKPHKQRRRQRNCSGGRIEQSPQTSPDGKGGRPLAFHRSSLRVGPGEGIGSL